MPKSLVGTLTAGWLGLLTGVMLSHGDSIRPAPKASSSAEPDYQTAALNGNLPVFYESMRDKLNFPLSWTSGNFKNFDEWRELARAKALEGVLPVVSDHTPFNSKVVAEEDRGTYLARKILFNLTAESRVLGLMLVPKGKGPFPAVLLLHDHGSKFDIGKEKMIKPWGDEAKLKSAQAWAERLLSGRFVGDELAARGYAVLAVDALGWGDRGLLTYEVQQALESNLLNLGSSLAGLMAFEDLRSAEFLASLPEVDPKRVGALGFSMGSFRAWQVAALTDTIKAGVAVCWMTTAKGVMVPGNNILRGQSSYWMTQPGLVRFLDFPDVASIAAPKPMLFYNGGQDALFSTDSVNAAYAKMKQVWQSQGAGEKLRTKLWPDLGHVFLKEQQDEAFDWLDQWLKAGK
jgi:dienelactone hydrolase